MKWGYIVGLFFCLVFPLVGNANEKSYDETFNKLDQASSTSQSEAEAIIESLLTSWTELSNDQRARLKMYQAILKTYGGDYQESIRLLREAIKLNPSEATLNKIYQYLSTNYIALNDYPAALALMAANLERIKEITDIDIKVGSYVRLANLALELDAYQDMRDYALQAMALSDDVDTRQHCFALLFVAVADLKQKQIFNAESSFQRSQIYCEEKKFPLIGLMSQKGLALVA
ncbi:tetratricopeptide repeat-containing diguanylate cyclase, partial [Shewanella sp. 0m-11]